MAAGSAIRFKDLWRDDEIDWDVLADPEGNEFCVFTKHDI
jgi:hypothetical protein